ncbi:hypothetical protein [Bacillus subtilis]
MSRKQQLQACWTGWREMVLSAAGIELTTEGKARLEQFLPGHFSKISAVMENYSDEEKDMFVKMLGDLFERLSVFKD